MTYNEFRQVYDQAKAEAYDAIKRMPSQIQLILEYVYLAATNETDPAKRMIKLSAVDALLTEYNITPRFIHTRIKLSENNTPETWPGYPDFTS